MWGSDCTLNSYGLPSYQLQYNCSSFYKTNINKSKSSAKKRIVKIKEYKHDITVLQINLKIYLSVNVMFKQSY